MYDIDKRKNITEERIPPFSREAEIACIGSIILDNSCYEVVSGIVVDSDFYNESLKRIYKAIQFLFESDIKVDHLTLSNCLRERGDFEKVGGLPAISKLTDNVSVTANVDHYAEIVKKKSDSRKIIYAAQEIVARGYSDSDDEIFHDTLDSFVDIAGKVGRSKMPDRIFDYGEDVVRLYEKVKNGYTGVPFPWDKMTDVTMGMWPGTVTIIVARPKIGKSVACILSARHAWKKGKRVLIISPEMSKQEMAERFFAFDSDISLGNIVKGTATDFEYEKLKLRVKVSEDLDDLWIIDGSDDLTGRGIDSVIRACKPNLVLADSIYMLKFKGRDFTERTIGASLWFGESSKRFDYAGCAFSQLNREAEKSEKKGGGIRLGTIGFTDQIPMGFHAIYAMEQTKDMKSDKIMRIIPLAARRPTNSYVDDFLVNWDFDRMNFKEVEEEKEEYKDDGEVPF